METQKITEIADVVVRFSGDSGDGMQLVGTLFSDAAAVGGNGISTFPDFPSEIRAPQGTVAGVSGFQVHLGAAKMTTPGDTCDTLVAMNPAALRANTRGLRPDSTIILDDDAFTPKEFRKAGLVSDDPIAELGLEGYNIVAPKITSLTREALEGLGLDVKSATKCKNMFALGLCFYLYNKPLEHTFEYIERKFAKKNPAIAEANVRALKAGFNYGANTHSFANTYNIKPAALPEGTYRMINGNQATAWGFIAASEKSGRPLFCGSYPITPATVILEELAKRRDLGVVTVQAEDEIAGICTSIGASFAGSLAVTTTSGPGLSLKSEAMGLAVMTELPLVVVDVQRGGPSTGLPTKTEQSDLLQALYGRNGEAPMVVIAASTPSDCFHYAFWAAKIALERMTPVLLLTDGFIANGSEPWCIPSMADYPAIKPPIIRELQGSQYFCYDRDPEAGARTWAIPGTPGLEHRIGGLEKDKRIGCVSHDPTNHHTMTELRAAKIARVASFIPTQEITTGDPEGDLLVVGWGGTRGHLQGAVEKLRAEGKRVSHCHFNWINPLPHGVEQIFSRFRQIVVCELNMGQFAGYLRMNFPQFAYLQYNKVQGLPFTIDELAAHFNSLI